MRLLRFPNPVNETSARLTAAGVVAVAFVAIAARQPWLVVALAVGFVARVLAGPRLSPLALLSTRVLTPALVRRGHRPCYTPGPPKRFAQAIGAAFTGAATITYFALRWHTTAFALVAVVAVFATLEAALGFCAGCRVFALLMRLRVVPADVCAACAEIRLRP